MSAPKKTQIPDDVMFDPSAMPPLPSDSGLRDSMRAPMRESAEESRRRAAEFMDKMRGHVGDVLGDDAPDKFHIPAADIPEGWDYQWKRHTLLNKEDPTYQVSLAQAGWVSVPTGRHPHLMPMGTPSDAPIMRDGNILMERPMELTELVRQSDARRAREQVRIKETQVSNAPAPGHFERSNQGNPLANIKKGYSPLEIPK